MKLRVMICIPRSVPFLILFPITIFNMIHDLKFISLLREER
jgi:hypothetical protein